MGFSKDRRQHRRQPSWLRIATAGNSPYAGSTRSEQSPWSSTQYTFAAAEASAFEDMASPTTLDEIGYAKKNDGWLEEAPVNAVKSAPTFATSGLDKYYRPVEGYEGMHRYDPDFEWEPEEEQRVVRKIDKRICAWVCIMFFALQLDRGNIVQALSDNMLDDLGLTTNDYNYGQTIFYISFLLAELPSQLISKWMGPDHWIPLQMVSWSVIASMQAFISGRKSFFLTRCLLGALEGGFVPEQILYLSYWYTSSEMPTRLSWFWVSSKATDMSSAFIAYVLLRLRGFFGAAGWQWLFFLEGLLTGVIGVLSWYYLPPGPTQTASPFRGEDGWFTPRQEKIMVNRVLRDDPSKGDMHNRQPITPQMLWECLADYHMWPLYLLGLTAFVPQYPMTAYLTLQLREIGFDTFDTNLLAVPPMCLYIIQLLFWTWLSEKLNERFLLATVGQLWSLPLLLALLALPLAAPAGLRYVLIAFLVGFPYVHAILVANTSRNAGTVRTRTVASALYNMCAQADNIIGSNIYREDDKPLYLRGNKVLIFFCIFNIIVFVGTKYFYVNVNRDREAKWDAMSHDDKEIYLATTRDKGNKRLDFRFAH
ncbi:major facilitator superfamily [Diplodia corticola]|uniref:Major facilitator superfamily n=1 Tax=Diplodia corticola TaxID=236234 RepID=A0A1J9S7H5_9PEZI|nr:major facilitator superfamily [Diplodia corticola]OJD35549.1 major facilitator superfamily [Diplodia corticola]